MIRDLLARVLPGTPKDASVPGPTALAMLHQRGAQYYVESSNRTRWREAGFWVSSGEVQVLDVSETDEAVGIALLVALAASRLEVPVPDRDGRLEAALFRAMGVRSRRASMSGTRACVLTREPPAGEVRIEPQVNGGSAGEERGYRPLPAKARLLPADASAASVGRAARAALGDSVVST